MRPADYPIRWERAFGWGEWRSFWRLVFPPEKVMIGYTVLRVGPKGWRGSWFMWPYWKIQRIRWAIRGPV